MNSRNRLQSRHASNHASVEHSAQVQQDSSQNTTGKKTILPVPKMKNYRLLPVQPVVWIRPCMHMTDNIPNKSKHERITWNKLFNPLYLPQNDAIFMGVFSS